MRVLGIGETTTNGDILQRRETFATETERERRWYELLPMRGVAWSAYFGSSGREEDVTKEVPVP